MLEHSSGIAALFAGAGLVLGCSGRIATQGEDTLFVEHVLAPQAAPSGYTHDPSQPSITNGVVDLALSQPYEPTYLLGSQFATQGAGDVTTVDGAEVRITDDSGNQLKTFTVLLGTTVVISPLPGSTVGYAPVTLTSRGPGALDGDTVLQNSLAVVVGPPGS